MSGSDFEMEPVRTLLGTTPADERPVLPRELFELYGGDLRFPEAPGGRPYTIANFVTTLDGVIGYEIPGKAGGGEISGHDEADRFVMGLLRASADAVMIASRTLRATDPEHLWTAAGIFPKCAGAYASYRETVLGKTGGPLTVIVTGSGDVDLDRAVFRTPGMDALILTTERGRERLENAGAAGLATTRVVAIPPPGNRIEPLAILSYLRRECGVRLLLNEGGPTLFGQFVADRLMDELFLTMAPQFAGRSVARPRPALIEGTAFEPETAPWTRIVSVKQRGNHLYLRYRPAISPATDISLNMA